MIPDPTEAIRIDGVTHAMLPAEAAPMTRCGVEPDPTGEQAAVLEIDCPACAWATNGARRIAADPKPMGSRVMRAIGGGWLLAAWLNDQGIDVDEDGLEEITPDDEQLAGIEGGWISDNFEALLSFSDRLARIKGGIGAVPIDLVLGVWRDLPVEMRREVNRRTPEDPDALRRQIESENGRAAWLQDLDDQADEMSSELEAVLVGLRASPDETRAPVIPPAAASWTEPSTGTTHDLLAGLRLTRCGVKVPPADEVHADASAVDCSACTLATAPSIMLLLTGGDVSSLRQAGANHLLAAEALDHGRSS